MYHTHTPTLTFVYMCALNADFLYHSLRLSHSTDFAITHFLLCVRPFLLLLIAFIVVVLMCFRLFVCVCVFVYVLLLALCSHLFNMPICATLTTAAPLTSEPLPSPSTLTHRSFFVCLTPACASEPLLSSYTPPFHLQSVIFA